MRDTTDTRGHHMTDHSRDELRRALREADAAQREAMPRFREALRRYFSPESRNAGDLTGAQRAVVLGAPVPVPVPAAAPAAPGRRAFFRTGGLAVAGAVALVACSSDDDPAETGLPPDTTNAAGGPTAGDVELATAAIEIENTAVAAYNAVAEARGADLQAAGAAEAALLFRDHHVEHAGALNGLLSDNGVDAVPEDQLFAGITLPDAEAIGSLPILDIAAFARGLENQAAQTYITAVPRLSIPALRQTLMSIGAVEARHVGAYDILLGGGVGGYASTAELIVGGNYPTDESFLNG
jgi:hypothetical protein